MSRHDTGASRAGERKRAAAAGMSHEQLVETVVQLHATLATVTLERDGAREALRQQVAGTAALVSAITGLSAKAARIAVASLTAATGGPAR